MSDPYSTHVNGFPDRGPAVLGVTTATLVLCSIFVAARMICRAFIVHRVSWDDYFIVVAWFLAFGLSFTIDYGTSKGLGRHDANIAEGDRGSLRRSEYVFSILYNPALMATKSSILIFYLRLSKNTQPILRLASYAVLVVVNLAGTVLTIINIFQCRPVEAAFAHVDVQPQCIPLLTEFICSAPVNIVTDLAILALPLPVLTGMRLPSRQKTILVITFALGIFVTIVDVIRIYYLQQAITVTSTGSSSDPNAIFGDTSDFSWNASLALMWSAVEVNVGITCACIPTLKPLIIKILPAMIADPDGTRATSDGQDPELSSKLTIMDAGGHQTHSSRRPSPLPSQNADGAASSEGITVLDFLTTPDMPLTTTTDIPVPPPSARRNPISTQLTSSSIGTTHTRQDNSVYFGFVNMKRPKSMLKTSASESFRYCTVVTILFFLWGFSYGLLNTLNNVVADVANMTTAQTLGLTSAYFGGGYFFGPLLIGEWVLRHDEHHRSKRRGSHSKHEDSIGGFKATFMVGLCFYGTGTIMFWPSAVLTSFPGFLISTFVVGFGLGVLETAANPFLALCGPADYAEMRLLLAQGVQGVGSVLSGLLAQNVYFVGPGNTASTGSMTLIDVQWTYLAITLLCVALALFFYYMPLPEVSDAELEKASSTLPVDTNKRSLGGFKLRTVCLVLAVVAQWTYVGAQESMSIFFRIIVTSWLPPDISDVASTGSSDQSDQPPGLSISVPNSLVIAHTAFAVSRFATGYLAYLAIKHPRNKLVPTPRTMLTVCAALSAFFALLTVVIQPRSNPNLILLPVVLYFFFEGPLWPLIFAMGLRGQGKRTKRAAAWITIGGSGPAFWPFVIYAVTNDGGSIQTAFIVVVVLLVVTLLYPLYLTFVKDARLVVDPRKDEKPTAAAAAADPSGEEGSRVLDTDAMIAQRRRTRGSGTTQESGGIISKLSRSLGSYKRRHRSTASSSSPIVEHVEGTDRREEEGQVSNIPEER